MHSKLILDHAGEQHRTAKSIQKDQIYVKDQIYSKQTGYMNSQSTEPEKVESHTPAIPNMIRDYVKENSLEYISPDPVQSTLLRLDTHPQASAASFDSKSEEGRKSQIHLHLHWRWPRNKVLTLQDLESQQEITRNNSQFI